MKTPATAPSPRKASAEPPCHGRQARGAPSPQKASTEPPRHGRWAQRLLVTEVKCGSLLPRMASTELPHHGRRMRSHHPRSTGELKWFGSKSEQCTSTSCTCQAVKNNAGPHPQCIRIRILSATKAARNKELLIASPAQFWGSSGDSN